MRRTISLFIAIVLILVTVGILILDSASSSKYEGAAAYFVKRQLIWLALSFCAATVTARFDYRYYQKLAVPLAVLSFFMLFLVWAPVIGLERNGSDRWIIIHGFTFQPSELAKVAVIILFAWWLSRNQRRIDEIVRGNIIPLGLLACFAVPILLESDFGTTMLLSTVVICMMFLSGVSMALLIVAGVIGVTGISIMISLDEERMGRVLAFLDPKKYESGEAWQLVNALRAFAGGNLWGVGFGNSMQKYDYLPEAHTDFIFPIIGEELGLIAALIVICMYITLFVLGLRIAIKARDDFGRFIAYGITLMISIQALINFAVVTGCVPTKGLALPFISYGGSSLMISGVMVGILVNIAYLSEHTPSKASQNIFKDRARKV